MEIGKFAINEANELLPVVNKVTILSNGLEAPECRAEVNTKKISRITGETKVNKVSFEDGSSMDVDGIFIALGEAGTGDFAKTLGIIQNGHDIKVNEKMETNIKGLFACGDATGGLYQVCKAVYEGATAGLSAVDYVRNLSKG